MKQIAQSKEVEPLSDIAQIALERVYADLQISTKAAEKINFATRLLRDFELYEKSQIPSEKEERKRLSEVARLSSELNAAIAKLDGFQKLKINAIAHKFFDKNTDFHDVAIYPDGILSFSDTYFLVLSGAALKALEEHPRTKISGRKSIRGHYFAYIYLIWRALDGEGLSLGRNGPFQRLCDVVFQAAGVHSSSEGSVRFFVENLPKSKKLIDFCESDQVE